MNDRRLFHGGAPGLTVGDIISPREGSDTGHLRDGCMVCEARRRGDPIPSDDNDPRLVYVTTCRDYARLYAAGYPKGALYRVTPVGELINRGDHDAAPSWGCPAARVEAVIDPLVTVTPKQLRLWIRRWMP